MDLVRESLLVALVAFFTGGCAAAPPPPPSTDDASILAVRIVNIAPVSIFASDSDEVFFVRVDSGEPTAQSTVLGSNYTDGDYVYLLGAEPGTYAVVATRNADDQNKTFTTYLPENLIRRSMVTVGDNDIGFMGSFEVQLSLDLNDMDAAQRHYIGIVQPGDRGGFSMFSSNYTYRGILEETDQSPAERERFFARAEKKLAEHGWAELLEAAAPVPGH